MGIIVAIGTLVTAILVQLLVEECKAWLPWVTERVIRLTVKRLPENQRERYGEEWRSCLNEIPGEIGKLLFALDFMRAGWKMSRIGQESQSLKERKSGFTASAVLVEKPGRATSMRLEYKLRPAVSGRIVLGNPVPKDDVSK